MKHKHYDMIVAWAKGEKIQARLKGGEWHALPHPNWNGKYIEYRIKPEPKPDWYKYVCIETAAGHMASWQSCSPVNANLRLTFDGETGNLKSAEVLK